MEETGNYSEVDILLLKMSLISVLGNLRKEYSGIKLIDIMLLLDLVHSVNTPNRDYLFFIDGEYKDDLYLHNIMDFIMGRELSFYLTNAEDRKKLNKTIEVLRIYVWANAEFNGFCRGYLKRKYYKKDSNEEVNQIQN